MGRRTASRWLAVALTSGVLLAGCGNDQDPAPSPAADRPSMEAVVDDYTQMRTEMLAAVDEVAGVRDWTVSSSVDGLSRSGCREGEDDDGERASLPSWASQGSLVEVDRGALSEAVWDVGRAHGFTETGTIIDRPDDVKIYGEDEHGGRYIFGSAVSSVLGISTGCHRWDVQPSPAPDPTGIPDYAKKDQD